MRRSSFFATADAVEDAFYDAMQRADIEAMMSLWADDEDVTCVHPSSGRLIGLTAIRASWTAIFEGGGGVQVRAAEVRAHTGAVIAVHNVIEQIIVEMHAGTQLVECIATNVYVKQASGWRILLHHSAPSAGEAPTPLSGGMLH